MDGHSKAVKSEILTLEAPTSTSYNYDKHTIVKMNIFNNDRVLLTCYNIFYRRDDSECVTVCGSMYSDAIQKKPEKNVF